MDRKARPKISPLHPEFAEFHSARKKSGADLGSPRLRILAEESSLGRNTSPGITAPRSKRAPQESNIAIEHARMQAVRKPWGSTDLRPWSDIPHDGAAIGELWCQRADPDAPEAALLLKLLFTKEPLSIQVHPDDAFARSIGLPHGKTEVWYILSAARGARVAVGLKRQLTAVQLRAAIEDGSILNLVQWRAVVKGDTVFVPAGTIHAVGAGLVIAEIQQRSDATFRLFDHGRGRELHVDEAVAAAIAGPAEPQPGTRRLSDERTLLVASPYFVLEHVDLPPKSTWTLDAEQETWILIVNGDARLGSVVVSVGDAIFLEAERTDFAAGPAGMTGLLAYPDLAARPGLLQSRVARVAASPPLHEGARTSLEGRA